MFYQIDNLVCLGRDKKHVHSTVVESNAFYVLSINRNSRKLTLHVWNIVSDEPFDVHEVRPVISTDYARLRTEYLKNYSLEMSDN